MQSVPFAAMVLQGRLAPLLQDAPPLEELRPMMSQLVQQLAGQGMTGRHEPFGAPAAEEPAEGQEPASDPRYAPAEDALMAGDLETAITLVTELVEPEA